MTLNSNNLVISFFIIQKGKKKKSLTIIILYKNLNIYLKKIKVKAEKQFKKEKKVKRKGIASHK